MVSASHVIFMRDKCINFQFDVEIHDNKSRESVEFEAAILDTYVTEVEKVICRFQTSIGLSILKLVDISSYVRA